MTLSTHTEGVRKRIRALDWTSLAGQLDAHGCAVMGPLLSPQQCVELKALYDQESAFRRRVVMSQHGYGQGEYQYFAYPLPNIVGQFRERLYGPLAQIANRWNESLRIDDRYPAKLQMFLDSCHAAGQRKPTPLMLKYGPGDFNCLHQDIYGELVFPLQVALLLSRPGTDYTGGEFVLTQQRPRMQSRPEVVTLDQGQGVIFPTRHRPVQGARGMHRVNMRHGVSRLHSGQRYTLGIIFHDAT